MLQIAQKIKKSNSLLVALVVVLLLLVGCSAETPTPAETILEIIPSPTSAIESSRQKTAQAVASSTSEVSPPGEAPPAEETAAPAASPEAGRPTSSTSPASAGNRYAVVGIEVGDSLPVHSAPRPDSAALGELPADAVNLELAGEVQVDQTGEHWAPVGYNNQTGWVKRANLAAQSGSPAPGLASKAVQVIQALNSQDFPELADLVHPGVGVRISPYAYIQPEDQVFSQNEVYYLMADSRGYLWGNQDGSGEPIMVSFPEYFKRYIFDVDFSKPEAIGFNMPLSSGSRINNIAEFYPGAEVVEYYFSGFDPQYGGMDWRSLRLIFVQVDSDWKLIGIVHDEWGP